MSQASIPSWEQKALASALEWYLSQGYEVHATASDEVPLELKGLGTIGQLAGLVDFVATRGRETVFVEVRRTGPGQAERDQSLESFARRVEALPNARLDVISLPHPFVGLPTRAGLLQALTTAETLVSDGEEQAFLQGAVALGGIVLEGALQVIAARNAVHSSRDVGIGSLAVELEVEGVLAPDDAAIVEGFASIRNSVVHPRLGGRSLDRAEVDRNLRNVRRFVDLAFMDTSEVVASFSETFGPATRTDEGEAETILTPTAGNETSRTEGNARSELPSIGVEDEVLDTRTIIERSYASVPEAIREEAIGALNGISRFWKLWPQEY
ncbi:hypothetical protein ACFQW6_03535 [Nocardioides sp. GCM10028917]|uniref:hypothetical protein n=1 Tax=Nocardioides sp. GCM10028917 TaxID=3273408 RepID=UPI003611F74B